MIKGLILWYPAIIYKNTNIFTDANVNLAIQQGYIETTSIRTGKVFRFSKELMLESQKYKPFDALIDNKLPKLFIHGDKDIDVDSTSTVECSKLSPNSELIIYHNGTHGFFTEPQIFTQVLKDTVDFIVKTVK